jgi:hypothetical protein
VYATWYFYFENQAQIPELWLLKTKLIDTKPQKANAPPLWMIDLIKSRKKTRKSTIPPSRRRAKKNLKK